MGSPLKLFLRINFGLIFGRSDVNSDGNFRTWRKCAVHLLKNVRSGFRMLTCVFEGSLLDTVGKGRRKVAVNTVP
jgi:hypothetical protein